MKVTYHKSHTVIDNEGNEINFVTNLYSIGVYGIVNNDPSMQGNFTPSQIKKMEKDLQKAVDKGEIKELVLGIPITVSDESGFWKEV